jgi:hypothetical protein
MDSYDEYFLTSLIISNTLLFIYFLKNEIYDKLNYNNSNDIETQTEKLSEDKSVQTEKLSEDKLVASKTIRKGRSILI